VLPTLLLIVAIVCLLDLPASVSMPWRQAGVLILAGLIAVWAIDFRYPNGRRDGPIWVSQVHEARAQCKHRAPTYRVTLYVAPGTASAPLTCDFLR
jgi:hypothetical protein